VTDRFFRTDPIPFYGMNPGLDCGVVSALALGLTPGWGPLG